MSDDKTTDIEVVDANKELRKAHIGDPIERFHDLLDKAMGHDAPSDAVKAITDAMQFFSTQAAAGAYNRAKADFQADCPPIPKRAKASFNTKAGAEVAFSYPDLDEDILPIVTPLAAKHGLSIRWEQSVSDDGKWLTETCWVTHEAGHSECSPFTLPTVDNNPLLSAQQKISKISTTAKRRSVVAILGLRGCEPSEAEMAQTGEREIQTITEGQAADLVALAQEVGVKQFKKFEAFMGVEKIEDLPATEYKRAVRELERKR